MSSHPMDSVIYGHLWGTEEVRSLIDDRGRTQSWLEILAALAEAQAEVGIIPQNAARQIAAHADVNLLDLEQIAAETRATGHSTLGLIRSLQQVLPADSSEWVYYGATVQDLSDTWTTVLIREMCRIADRELARLEAAATRLAEEHATTVMSGRTHAQVGLPITFGFKAAVWVSEVRRHRQRLTDGAQRWNVVQLGGAIGTMEFWGERALPLLEAFARRLDLDAPDIAWLTARDRIAEFVTTMGLVTATLGKIGQEILHLQRTELGEVRETPSAGVVGSITMPHKVNPELSEHLVTLAGIVRSKAGLALAAMLQQHERDGSAWKSEWIVLPETCSLSAAALSFAGDLVEGLQVDATRMRTNLDSCGGYALSEPVLRTLAPLIGKHRAHDLVYRAAMRGIAEQVSFLEVLLTEPEVSKFISAPDLERLLAPEAGIGPAPEFVRRVLDAEDRRS